MAGVCRFAESEGGGVNLLGVSLLVLIWLGIGVAVVALISLVLSFRTPPSPADRNQEERL